MAWLLQKTGWLLLFCLAIMCGCRGIYEGFKAIGKEACYSLPYPDQQECLRENDVDYEEYERQRSDAQSGPENVTVDTK